MWSDFIGILGVTIVLCADIHILTIMSGDVYMSVHPIVDKTDVQFTFTFLSMHTLLYEPGRVHI